MPNLSNRAVLHRRLSTFVDWIKTDRDKIDLIRRQAQEIRDRLCARAAEDGLVIRSTPNAGSFAKRTGLRRHLPGGSVIEGQDVDLAFVVAPRTRAQEEITELLGRFDGYAARSYPSVEREKKKSSVRLSFVASKLRYDIVPMLATDVEEEQILLRGDGVRRRTSVQRHIEFIRGRTRSSDEIAGRVMFNECVRLVKWWREFRQSESRILSEVPTMVVDLICAKAYDERSIETTYAETLADWFGWAAHAIRARRTIAFSDFCTPPAGGGAASWSMLDPVNPDNNVVSTWSGWEVDELAGWFEAGRDIWARAIRCDRQGEDAESLRHLIALFGSPIHHHCGD